MPITWSRSVSSLIQASLTQQASTAPSLNQFWLHSTEEVERLDYLGVFVYQLRRKVAEKPSKLSIHTVLKIGYFIRFPAGVS